MSKHTAGPWFIGVSSDDDQIHCIDAFDISRGRGNLEVCKVWGTVNDTEESDQSKANARLIAAAPELLEALEVVLNAGRGTSRRIILDAEDEALARAAIARARGEA